MRERALRELRDAREFAEKKFPPSEVRGANAQDERENGRREVDARGVAARGDRAARPHERQRAGERRA